MVIVASVAVIVIQCCIKFGLNKKASFEQVVTFKGT